MSSFGTRHIEKERNFGNFGQEGSFSDKPKMPTSVRLLEVSADEEEEEELEDGAQYNHFTMKIMSMSHHLTSIHCQYLRSNRLTSVEVGI